MWKDEIVGDAPAETCAQLQTCCKVVDRTIARRATRCPTPGSSGRAALAAEPCYVMQSTKT